MTTLDLIQTFWPAVAGAIAAVWYFWRKNAEDKREAEQEQDTTRLKHVLQQDIFTADQLSELTQKLISYFLEDDSVKRDQILDYAKQTATRDQIRELENRLVAMEHKFTILVSTISEIYDYVRVGRPDGGNNPD